MHSLLPIGPVMMTKPGEVDVTKRWKISAGELVMTNDLGVALHCALWSCVVALCTVWSLCAVACPDSLVTDDWDARLVLVTLFCFCIFHIQGGFFNWPP